MKILPQLAGGGGPLPKAVVEGPPSQRAVFHRRPSTIAIAMVPLPETSSGRI